MKKVVFSFLSILTTVTFLLFAGCTEDLPDKEDLSPGSQLKSAKVDSPINGRGSKVVFTSTRDKVKDLWAMNIDRTNLTQLTYGNYRPGFKDISPDGQKVVFGCKRNNNIDIYIVNIDGSGPPQRLTDFEGPDADPRFTQDGEKIVFRSNMDGPGEIYTMNLDGSEVERLTYLDWWNHSPCLSKNGKELLFVRAIMEKGDIYKMDLISGDTVRLTFDGFHKHLPSWSNNGKKIVFAARVGPVLDPKNKPPFDIFVMDADGNNIENLTNYPDEDRHPCWSPNGKHIVFHRRVPGMGIQLWVMKADGSDPVQITEGDLNNFPAWGPGRIE